MQEEKLKEKIIDVQGVSKSFGEKGVLEDVSIHVCHNEIVSVLGISGSGKTTLFNIITNLESSYTGEVHSPSEIGYMLQKDLLMPWKTVIDNIALPLLLRGIPKSEAYATVEGYLEKFGLKGVQKQYPSTLSGGMRQRASLLRTYLISGEALLLDEPFSSVDAITRRKLHKWLLEIFKNMELTILLITHDVEEALLLSDRIYILGGTPAKVAEEIVLTKKGRSKTSSGNFLSREEARKKIFEILEKEEN